MRIVPPLVGKHQYAHVGCPQCGAVFAVPLDEDETPPWCIHSYFNYAWADPTPLTQSGPRPWVRLVRVNVSTLT